MLAEHLDSDEGASTRRETVRARRRADGRVFYSALGLPGVILLVLMFVAPMIALLVASVAEVDAANQPIFGTFTTSNYEEALQPYYLPILWRTMAFAAVTTAVCVVVAYPVAYYARRHAGRWGGIIIGFILLTWLVDYIVRLYAWITILDQQGLLSQLLGWLGLPPWGTVGSASAVMIGLIYGYFPIAVVPIYAAVGELDKSVVEAANDLYATPRRAFFRVTLPLTKGGVVASAMLVFLPALGDYATAQLLGGNKQTMVGNFVNDQFANGGLVPVGSAEVVLLLLIVFVFVIACWSISRRSLAIATGRAMSA